MSLYKTILRFVIPHALGLCALFASTLSSQHAVAQTKAKPPAISAAFEYESKYVNVKGSRMHYVELGSGAPIVFVHGIPTSSYLWRNVLPFVAEPGRRIIAVDNIGYGKSGKPDIHYGLIEQAEYLEGFIKELGLSNVTLVLHDLGGAFGLHYAWRNPSNVKAIAYLEAAVPPIYPRAAYSSFGPLEPLFRDFRDPVKGKQLLVDENYWIERILPASVMRDLSAQELAAYREPFAEPASRRAILDLVQTLPIAGEPKREWAAFESITAWWKETNIPKLVMYSTPSRVINKQSADWAVANLKNVETAFVGHSIHYLQEDQPEAVGRATSEWIRRVGVKP
jgi:haloalkane dehalogenase